MSKKIQIPNPIKVVETGTPTTENLMKGQVAIKEEDGKLVLFGNVGGEKIQSTVPKKYDYNKLMSLTEESSDADIRAALTPIGETEVVWPNIGDEVVSSITDIRKGFFTSVNSNSSARDLYFIFYNQLYNIYIGSSISGYSVFSVYSINLQDINIQSEHFDISNMVQVIGIEEDGLNVSFDSVCVRAPKGLLCDGMFVRLYRKIKGVSYYSDLGDGRNKNKYRIKRGWLNFCNMGYPHNASFSNFQIHAVLTQIQTRSDMDSGYNAKDGYEYFNIIVFDKETSGKNYSKLFSEMVKDNCYFTTKHPDLNKWEVLQIKNGCRKKTIFNPAIDSQFDTVFNNKCRVTTWGLQVQSDDLSDKYPYTSIIPFYLRISVGTYNEEYTVSEINDFGYDDIKIRLVKST